MEGLLAALEACGVNNCRIEVRGDEVPFMDGSARPFVRLIHMAGASRPVRLLFDIGYGWCWSPGSVSAVRVQDDLVGV